MFLTSLRTAGNRERERGLTVTYIYNGMFLAYWIALALNMVIQAVVLITVVVKMNWQKEADLVADVYNMIVNVNEQIYSFFYIFRQRNEQVC